MRLYVDLSPTEQANIAGWVNKGLADPAFADFPWRIVLEERTRARFDQIASQFASAPVIMPPPATPAGDFCDPDKDIRWTVAWDDYKRYCTRDVMDFRFNNVCLAFTIPADKTKPLGLDGYVSFAEFDGNPITRHMTISRSACDFRPVDPTGVNGPFAECYGKQATLNFNVLACRSQDGVALQPGATYYVNIRNWSPEKNAPSPPPIEDDWIELENGSRILRGYAAGGSFIWPHD